MKLVVTGGAGFLGWHTRARLHTLTDHEVVSVDLAEWDRLPELLSGCDAIIHLAGINRDTDERVERGNEELARHLVGACEQAGAIPTIVYSNTIHADSDTPYGRGKSSAARVLAQATRGWGSGFTDVRLPNLFGEHGRPAYNSFVATFVDAVAHDRPPTSVVDRPIDLLHVQRAAAALMAAVDRPAGRLEPAGVTTSVQQVLDLLTHFRATYRTGEFPALDDAFHVDLFNTFRAALFPEQYPIGLTAHTDPRGRLVETVRCHGGPGQTFVSTTKPGITRGEHYHLGKVERFAVVSGSARISLRKVLTDEMVHFDVDGDAPAVIDMPTLWVHNITNTGTGDLTTVFWTNSLFDPDAPDTYWEPVEPKDAAC